MKRATVVIVTLLTLVSAIALLAAPVLASSGKEGDKALQITTDPKYERNPSFFRAADGTYWLFFAKGRYPEGIRGSNGYDPDTDSYDIYYKTAKSIPALQKTAEKLVTGSDLVTYNTQRDIAALQASDGTIWVFTSSGYAPSSDARIFYYKYDGSTWSGPTPIEGTSYAGHIDALEYSGKIWVFFDAWEYILQVTYWDGVGWSSPATISEKATIAKAIVDSGTFYLVWSYIDPYAGEWGKYIGLSASTDGIAWTTHGAIASWPGATNWDPVITKDRNKFRLFWAPDAGSEGQFIATSTSTNAVDLASWSTPVQVTTASYNTNNWWDFWPQPYYKGATYLLYTSERNSTGTDKTNGNIWMMHITVPLTK